MTRNKFKAFWFSSSSLSDYKKCPKSYYFRNIYKTDDGKKISTVSPYLSLGVAVHDTLEDLAWIPSAERLSQSLVAKFDKLYSAYKGKKGGFKNDYEYEEFQENGREMIRKVEKDPRIIAKPAVRMTQDKSELPWTWLDEESDIVISGKVDWLEYTNGKINIIDFKTNKKDEEKSDSLQFHIYRLLVPKFKRYPINKAFYWYLAQDKPLVEKELPTEKESFNMLKEQCEIVKAARLASNFKCPYDGCWNCSPYERILRGEGEYIGIGGYGSHQYYLPKK